MPLPRVHFLVPHDRPQSTLMQATTILRAGAAGVFLTPQVSGRARDLVSLAVTLQSEFPQQVVGVRRLGQASVPEAEEGFRKGVSAMWVPRGTPPKNEPPKDTPVTQWSLGEDGDMKAHRLWATLAFTPGHKGRARVRAQAMAQAGWVPVINSQHPDAPACVSALRDLPLFKGVRRASLGWLVQWGNDWPTVPDPVTEVLLAPPSSSWGRTMLAQALSTALGE